MKYEIRPFDIETASDADWEMFYNFSRDTTKELFPDMPFGDLASIRDSMIRNLLFNHVKAYIVVRTDAPAEVIGWVRCTFLKEDDPSFPGNEDVCEMHLTIHKDYRMEGIAQKLVKLAYEHALEFNRTKITGSLISEASRRFLQRVGGKEALAYRVNQLAMNDVDWDLIESWVNEGSQRSSELSMDFHLSIPDSILEDYCKIYTEVLNQAPRDELTLGDEVFTPEKWKKMEAQTKESNRTWISAVVRAENGDIAGLTDVGYDPSTPTVVYQYLTGVQKKYRGKGLGKWLKAAMLLKIRDEYPDVEVISTSNATSNEPMLAINQKMGFRMKLESYMFEEVGVDKVKEYLSQID
ncbi:MAG: GNAT family N-acetyltransferase [Candidatus Thorarchaeota archaeon]